MSFCLISVEFRKVGRADCDVASGVAAAAAVADLDVGVAEWKRKTPSNLVKGELTNQFRTVEAIWRMSSFCRVRRTLLPFSQGLDRPLPDVPVNQHVFSTNFLLYDYDIIFTLFIITICIYSCDLPLCPRKKINKRVHTGPEIACINAQLCVFDTVYCVFLIWKTCNVEKVNIRGVFDTNLDIRRKFWVVYWCFWFGPRSVSQCSWEKFIVQKWSWLIFVPINKKMNDLMQRGRNQGSSETRKNSRGL